MGKRCVELDEELLKKIENMLDKLGFSSVEEFVEFVVREAVEAAGVAGAGMSREDEEKVKERLRNLGYI